MGVVFVLLILKINFEREINLVFHIFMHLLVITGTLTEDQTCNLGIWGTVHLLAMLLMENLRKIQDDINGQLDNGMCWRKYRELQLLDN